MDKLKRCPICGGEAILSRTRSAYSSADKAICDEWHVFCKECGLSTSSFYDKIYREGSGNLIVDEDGVIKAKNAWNRRCPDAEQDH